MRPRELRAGETWRFEGLAVVDGRGGSFHDAALVVGGGKIQDLGPTAEVKARHGGARAIDARGYLAIPSLVNAHIHAAMGFFRGLGHGHDQMIETVLFPAEKALTPELLEPLSYSYLFACLRNGVGTVADHYYFSEGVARAADRLGLRAVIGETVADLGGAFPGRDSWERARRSLDAWPHSSRITPCVAPHAADTVSRPLLTELSAFAKDRKLPLHMHLSQTEGERTRVAKREKQSPVAYADACGALTERTLAVHLTAIDDADVQILARTAATAGFCPASQIIYEKVAPVAKLLQGGVPLALGTDCAASNDDADVLAEMRLAALIAQDRGDGRFLTEPHALLQTATANPARVLGLGGIVGALAPGYAADVSFLRVGLEAEPMPRPEVNLAFSLSGRDVRHVMVDGRFVLIDGAPALVSEDDLRLAYRAAVAEIGRRNGRGQAAVKGALP